jgi:4a-hydroxytetrahydrobiopterin dehydratase
MTLNIINDLSSRKCVACEGGVAPLSREEAAILLKQVPGWKLALDGKSIKRQYTLKNFMEIIHLVNKVAEIAESEGHHPDLHITDYRNLEINLSTHVIGGLSQNDFIMAAKIDKLS